MVKIYKPLYPLAWLYGLGVRLRNALFDCGVLRSVSFPLPVICVGNLTVGGTGKTPHTEYLIRLLTASGMHTGVLSRGYKRKSKGFLWADAGTPMEQIGDEPFQMRSKFPDIRLAVDADRPHGIRCMTAPEVTPPLDVILLDDAYQHRYVKAGLNILLTDYRRPIYEDALLPAGRLREPLSGKSRADIVVVSKCPPRLSESEAEAIRQRLCLEEKQSLFFSTLRYGDLHPFDGPTDATRPLSSLTEDTPVLVLTGIASPDKLLHDLQGYTRRISSLRFPDHHQFTDGDAETINRRFAEAGAGTLLLTTEKDATRLHHLPLSDEVKRNLYILPIEVDILFGERLVFNQKILDYVGTYSRDNRLPA